MSVDLFAAFATDKDAERKGTPTLIPGCGDTKFLLARASSANVAYSQLAQKLYKRNKQALDSGGELAAETNRKIMAELYSKTVLLGWEGTILYKGKQEPYSQELAYQLLMHNDFREAVAAVAEARETFLAQEQAESEGN